MIQVSHETSTDIKENLSSWGLNVLIKSVVHLPGIFSARHLVCIEDGIVMHCCTDANYFVKKLPNHCNEADKEVPDSKSVGVKVIKNGMFVIVPKFVQAKSKAQNAFWL